MKSQYFKIIVLLITITATSVNAQWKHIGKEFSIETTTPISELIEHPEKYYNRDVRVEGIIASACNEEGCFIEVVSKDGNGDGIVVNFPELIHKFPTDCAGREVVVEGMFYQKIYPRSRVSHWQGHSFRKGVNIPEFSLIKRINAKSVSISENKYVIPKPHKIELTSVDKIDLDKMEFETDGVGCGKKVLAPGDSVEEHSSANYREIIYCIDGKITVYREGAASTKISSGEMTFIPINTKHKIVNELDKPAAYLFVFSRKIELEPEHK